MYSWEIGKNAYKSQWRLNCSQLTAEAVEETARVRRYQLKPQPNFQRPLVWCLCVCHPMYLLSKCGFSQLRVFLGIGQDGLQWAPQVLLIEVLWRPHKRGEWHGDLHLHSGKVLCKRDAAGVSKAGQARKIIQILSQIKAEAMLGMDSAEHSSRVDWFKLKIT